MLLVSIQNVFRKDDRKMSCTCVGSPGKQRTPTTEPPRVSLQVWNPRNTVRCLNTITASNSPVWVREYKQNVPCCRFTPWELEGLGWYPTFYRWRTNSFLPVTVNRVMMSTIGLTLVSAVGRYVGVGIYWIPGKRFLLKVNATYDNVPKLSNISGKRTGVALIHHLRKMWILQLFIKQGRG